MYEAGKEERERSGDALICRRFTGFGLGENARVLRPRLISPFEDLDFQLGQLISQGKFDKMKIFMEFKQSLNSN